MSRLGLRGWSLQENILLVHCTSEINSYCGTAKIYNVQRDCRLQEPVFRGSTPEVLLDNRVERVFCNLDKAGHQRFFSDSPFNPSFLLILQAEEVYVRENEVQDRY
jgi:hypothetical protein